MYPRSFCQHWITHEWQRGPMIVITNLRYFTWRTAFLECTGLPKPSIRATPPGAWSLSIRQASRTLTSTMQRYLLGFHSCKLDLNRPPLATDYTIGTMVVWKWSVLYISKIYLRPRVKWTERELDLRRIFWKAISQSSTMLRFTGTHEFAWHILHHILQPRSLSLFSYSRPSETSSGNRSWPVYARGTRSSTGGAEGYSSSARGQSEFTTKWGIANTVRSQSRAKFSRP